MHSKLCIASSGFRFALWLAIYDGVRRQRAATVAGKRIEFSSCVVPKRRASSPNQSTGTYILLLINLAIMELPETDRNSISSRNHKFFKLK